MNRSTETTQNHNDSNAFRTAIVSAFGLLPVGVVSSMMLMQMLGIWTY